MITQSEAGALLCPFVARPGTSTKCEAARCMAWRWSHPLIRIDQKVFFPETELEPGDPEPLRPDKVEAHWPWTPITVTGEGEDQEYHGGYWEEPEADCEARKTAAAAARRGYCALIGTP